jgi:hypothetical protein
MKKNNLVVCGLLCIATPFTYAATEEVPTILHIPLPIPVKVISTNTFVDTETALRLASLITACVGATVFLVAFKHTINEQPTPTSNKDSLGMSGGLILMVVSIGVILKSSWLVRYFDSSA